MTVISYEYLETVHKKHNLGLLLDKVLTRYNRCSFERVISVLLQYHVKEEPLLGNIHEYCIWKSIRFNNKSKYNHLPIIKVWTGR